MMLSRITGIAYWVVLLGLIGAGLILVGSGYWIEVNGLYGIGYFPEDPERGAFLQYQPTGKIVATHVEGFAQLDGFVAGASDKGLFIASPEGKIAMYSERHSWEAACEEIAPAFDGHLSTPGLLKSSRLVRALTGLGGLIIIWAIVGAAVRRPLNRRKRHNPSFNTA